MNRPTVSSRREYYGNHCTRRSRCVDTEYMRCQGSGSNVVTCSFLRVGICKKVKIIPGQVPFGSSWSPPGTRAEQWERDDNYRSSSDGEIMYVSGIWRVTILGTHKLNKVCLEGKISKRRWSKTAPPRGERSLWRVTWIKYILLSRLRPVAIEHNELRAEIRNALVVCALVTCS